MSHTIEQGRAKTAFAHVQKAEQMGGDAPDKYKSYVKKLPTLIQVNGLGTALTFVKGKSGPDGDDARAYQLLYDQIESWLLSDSNAHLFANAARGGDLIHKVTSLDSPTYRAATREVMRLLHWLRRLVDGYITSSD